MQSSPHNIISWNVNGLRAVIKKDPEIFNTIIKQYEVDIICLQETKIQCIHESKMPIPSGFKPYWCSSTVKKGYSGVAILVKENIEIESIDCDSEFKDEIEEGRILCISFADFHLVNVYVPNSGMELGRIDYRTGVWDIKLQNYIKNLNETKSVIICGDFNIAHLPIDFYNPKKYSQKSAGLTEIERAGFQSILDAGFIDTYRYLYPDVADKFSYWSAKTKARPQNKGMRIDYFLCSSEFINNVVESNMLCDIMGSDHCPILLSIK